MDLEIAQVKTPSSVTITKDHGGSKFVHSSHSVVYW